MVANDVFPACKKNGTSGCCHADVEVGQRLGEKKAYPYPPCVHKALPRCFARSETCVALRPAMCENPNTLAPPLSALVGIWQGDRQT